MPDLPTRPDQLRGIEQALVSADTAALSILLHAEPVAASTQVGGLAPLLALLRHSTGSAAQVRGCARQLLDAGADLNRPWDRWDLGRRPLALAARCGAVDALLTQYPPTP